LILFWATWIQNTLRILIISYYFLVRLDFPIFLPFRFSYQQL
jgi:hypothetical protein